MIPDAMQKLGSHRRFERLNPFDQKKECHSHPFVRFRWFASKRIDVDTQTSGVSSQLAIPQSSASLRHGDIGQLFLERC